MRKHLMMIVGLISMLSACDQGAHSTRGFRFPEGNADNGRALFGSYGCVLCHTIEGVDTPGPTIIATPVTLGGPVALNKTYADILTSIVNPSHRISPTLDQDVVQENGESVMLNYNEEMTVAELIDLVTFIETQYELVDVPHTRP